MIFLDLDMNNKYFVMILKIQIPYLQIYPRKRRISNIEEYVPKTQYIWSTQTVPIALLLPGDLRGLFMNPPLRFTQFKDAPFPFVISKNVYQMCQITYNFQYKFCNYTLYLFSSVNDKTFYYRDQYLFVTIINLFGCLAFCGITLLTLWKLM